MQGRPFSFRKRLSHFIQHFIQFRQSGLFAAISQDYLAQDFITINQKTLSLMKKIILMGSAIAAITVFAVVGCNQAKTKEPAKEPLTSEALIKRGEYLVSAVGCDDCHTPKIFQPDGHFELDMERRFSGHPSSDPSGKVDTSVFRNGWILFGSDLTSASGPWGISYAANISSDTTGIGMWTENQFFTAIRKGIYKGLESNRPLLPPMPWFVYKNFNDDDLRAIFAYLKSTKPVKNVVPTWKKLNEL